MITTIKALRTIISESLAPAPSYSQLPEEWSQALGDCVNAARVLSEPDNPEVLDSFDRTLRAAQCLSRDSYEAEDLVKLLHRIMSRVNSGRQAELDLDETSRLMQNLLGTAWKHAHGGRPGAKARDAETIAIKHEIGRLESLSRGEGLLMYYAKADFKDDPEKGAKAIEEQVTEVESGLKRLKALVPTVNTSTVSAALRSVFKASRRLHFSRAAALAGEEGIEVWNDIDRTACALRALSAVAGDCARITLRKAKIDSTPPTRDGN